MTHKEIKERTTGNKDSNTSSSNLIGKDRGRDKIKGNRDKDRNGKLQDDSKGTNLDKDKTSKSKDLGKEVTTLLIINMNTPIHSTNTTNNPETEVNNIYNYRQALGIWISSITSHLMVMDRRTPWQISSKSSYLS